MAPGIGEKGGPMRVFVLVEKGAVQGVFMSWDEAETFADEHRLSLDHLFEYVTRHDNPDHLHLLAAEWDGGWEFHGEWKRETPRWKQQPTRVRLDHYHIRSKVFRILRQKEFDWSTGLLLKIDPMAPDMILEQVGSQKPVTPAQQWRPKLGALKTSAPEPEPQKEEQESGEPEVVHEKKEPAIGKLPLISDPEPAMEDLPVPLKAVSDPETPRIKPALERAPVQKPRLSEDTKKPIEPESPVQNGPLALDDKPKISFPKRKPLKLKGRETPEPIPAFAPTVPLPEPTSSKSSVELAQLLAEKDKEPNEAITGKPKRVWPMRLYVAIAAVLIGWGGGISWIFRAQPTAEEIVSSVIALNPASVITIEPGQVFFQLPIDPIHQQRWVRSLAMNPIPVDTHIYIPHHHTLETWTQASAFVRPPYAPIEVREWWDLRLRDVTYGFTMDWEDGSTLILDLESDMLIGWMNAKHLPEVLN